MLEICSIIGVIEAIRVISRLENLPVRFKTGSHIGKNLRDCPRLPPPAIPKIGICIRIQRVGIDFTYGGSLTEPKMSLMMSVESLRAAAKWTKFGLVSDRVSSQEQPLKLKDLFTIKRRLATGANIFFMLTTEQISAYQLPMEFLQPVLPSPRLLSVDEIEADSLRNPILERQLFLLSCDLLPDVVKAKYPALWEYLQIGV
ncbi:hypothetical protein [Microcoleus sp. FACHB-672]|uniref:hypothetical protein n=1 Tax=Microcoleus sp. FACHB-672 TaxID=2692825 RepID=UPI001683DDD0|nr:hypothetical protein [Microcoleus sp. FACHB-672]MBD2043028.1 hypothetical protein [Microcoleus sp. FACHB-672]